MGTRSRPDRDALQQQFVARFPVLVGVDAAKQKHTFAVRGPDGVVGPSEDVALTRLALDAWRAALQAHYPGLRPDQVLIGIEFAGALGATLTRYFRQHGYPVVAVPAKAAKQTREGSLSGRNKTDRVDARHICTTLSRGLYVRYPELRSPIAELKVLTMSYHKLSVERARLKNRHPLHASRGRLARSTGMVRPQRPPHPHSIHQPFVISSATLTRGQARQPGRAPSAPSYTRPALHSRLDQYSSIKRTGGPIIR